MAAAMAVVVMLLGLGGCTSEQNFYCQFQDVPSHGWVSQVPLKFEPQFPDSTINGCEIILSVRHNNNFAYRSLNLIVDVMDSLHHVVRTPVSIAVSDEYGNLNGSGFGGLYQCSASVVESIPCSAVKSIIVWPAMKGCDTIMNVEDVGITLKAAK